MQGDKKQSDFKNKLFRLLPRPTRQCPKDIGYHEVVAYGELLYRSRLNLKTTPADLATATGCERWHTLPKIIKRLQEHGLADEQLRAIADNNKYFHRKRTQKRKWQDEFQTTIIYRLALGEQLTDIQNSILWTVHSFNSAGQRPHPSSLAKLLRLDVRTVIKHLKWLQQNNYLDADGCVCADPSHWQDAVPKLRNDPEVRWEEFAAEWVGSRYDDHYCAGKPYFAQSHSHFRRSLQESCEAMAQAGYTSVQIREYWEEDIPEAFESKKQPTQLWLMEYFVHRMFLQMFEAIERTTTHNRQMGKFHGENSLGLLRKATAAQSRIMKARLVEGGMEGLELWVPDFSLLGTTARPKVRNIATRMSEPVVDDGHFVHQLPCDREGFDKMLRGRSPELDCDLWLERLLRSPQFKDDAEQLYLDCHRALDDHETRRRRNLERLLLRSNGKA